MIARPNLICLPLVLRHGRDEHAGNQQRQSCKWEADGPFCFSGYEQYYGDDKQCNGYSYFNRQHMIDEVLPLIGVACPGTGKHHEGEAEHCIKCNGNYKPDCSRKAGNRKKHDDRPPKGDNPKREQDEYLFSRSLGRPQDKKCQEGV